MEFLRFGSSIPGSYWGCCAVDIIQNFKQDPDAPASIQLVSGDGGMPLTDAAGGSRFLGMTEHEVFKARLRINTFNLGDKPNHTFFAILTASQISYDPGKKWLAILKEEGFEFVRAIDNSVYTGASLGEIGEGSPHINYIFALYRNIGKGAIKDPFQPPAAWVELDTAGPHLVNEPWRYLEEHQRESLVEDARSYHKIRWEAIGPVKTYTEKELEDANVPVTYAGKRSTYPQQEKATRLAAEAQNGVVPAANPFASVPLPSSVVSADVDEDDLEDVDF